MKKNLQILALLTLISGISFISSCSKDDHFANLSAAASPERALAKDTTDDSGYWIVQTKITVLPD